MWEVGLSWVLWDVGSRKERNEGKVRHLQWGRYEYWSMRVGGSELSR